MKNRRGFLKSMGLTGAALAASPLATYVHGAPATEGIPAVMTGARKPKRVIFLVSDGMSQAVVSLAEAFSNRVRQRPTHFAQLLASGSVAHGLFETYSLNSNVTDSAAAATAWGSGSRVFNGAINSLPDGTPLKPILPLLKEQVGISTGLVTTATVTHATPAGFAAVATNRGSESDIAPQYLGSVDVVLGGGSRFFAADRREDGRDMYAEYEAAGYTVVKSRAELMALAAETRQMLGIFWGSHVPYTIDHMNDDELLEKVPTLAEMTEAALRALSANENGFVLQVEGARIDHAAHANDAGAILWDQLAFDDALGVALEFARQHEDTLVVVTSDHGNSNPGLNGMGSSYRDSNECFARLALARASYGTIERQLKAGGNPDVAKVQVVVKDLLGIELTEAEAGLVVDRLGDKEVFEINRQHQGFSGIFAQIIGNHTGIGWTGSTHTDDYTLIAAQGPGQEAFGRLLRNTDFFSIMTNAYGVDYRNPTMSTEEAKAHMAMVPVIREAHWA